MKRIIFLRVESSPLRGKRENYSVNIIIKYLFAKENVFLRNYLKKKKQKRVVILILKCVGNVGFWRGASIKSGVLRSGDLDLRERKYASMDVFIAKKVVESHRRGKGKRREGEVVEAKGIEGKRGKK